MGNIRKQCPKCGHWVDGEYVSGSSVDQDTRSGLKVAANIFVKAGQALEFLPGGGFVGRMMSGGAKALIDSAADSMSTRSGYRFKCHHCDHSWTDHNVSNTGSTNNSTYIYRGKLSEPEVTAIIKVIIIDKLSVEAEEVTYNTSFQNDLGADSLDVVELIMEFERVFDITIPDDEAERFTTVGDAIRYISPILGRR